ncbi:translation initiation factor eIF-2B subunit gamma [Quillaja saponaria]|uniref:Translation initiation factor eIF2B subunit gamma n=1 Tax=Quillaja saponaria TaxID=32244 RepID=A0AAD7LVR1_QUISA|nr:translation initiation factor eIF-2B subunit gamma [Quillaja saponaria]
MLLVAAVPADVGTAGAIRAIAHHLTAKYILVVSGDLISDVPSVDLQRDPLVERQTKKAGRYNLIGLDSTKQFLLYIATGSEVEKDIQVQKSILRAANEMEIRDDLMDAHLYVFKISALQEVLDQKDTFHSLKQDVLPYLVRSQLDSSIRNQKVLLNGPPQAQQNGTEKVNSQNNQLMISQILANSSQPSFYEMYAVGPNGSASVLSTHKCCVLIASNRKYCARLNSVQAYSDINRDVGPHCMLGEGSKMGDKCSVKRSVIGRHCRIGSNVKVVNSVVMDHVTIADDCQVGAGFVVTAGSECRGDALARKEK